MKLMDKFMDSMSNYLSHLKLNIEDENLIFSEFIRFFDQNFNNLSNSDQDRLLNILERDIKLKNLLSENEK